MRQYKIDPFLLYSGQNVFFPQGEFYLHQPTMEEWALFGENNYYLITKILSSNPKNLMSQQGKTVPPDIENFDIIMAQLEDLNSPISLIIQSFLKLTIVGSSGYMYYPDRIIFKIEQDFKFVDRETFKELTNYWLQILDYDNSTAKEDFNPVNARAAAIAEKLKKGRDKAAQEKGLHKEQTSIFQYTCVMLSTNGYTQVEINQMTIVQLNSISNLYRRKEIYDQWFLGGIFAGHGDGEPMTHWLQPEEKE